VLSSASASVDEWLEDTAYIAHLRAFLREHDG
jgi:hypothetical protein